MSAAAGTQFDARQHPGGARGDNARVEVLYVLIPLGVLVALAAGAVFVVAAQRGQFDALEEQGGIILEDDRER